MWKSRGWPIKRFKRISAIKIVSDEWIYFSEYNSLSAEPIFYVRYNCYLENYISVQKAEIFFQIDS